MSNVRYELTENELQGRGPKVLYLSVSKSGADWLSLSHSHPHTELLFVTSGAGWFRLNGRDYPIRRGNLAVANPDTVHTEISSPDKPLKCLIVGVENAAFDLRRNGSDGESCPVFAFPGHSDGLSTYLLAIERSCPKNRKTTFSSLITWPMRCCCTRCGTRGCAPFRNGTKPPSRNALSSGST